MDRDFFEPKQTGFGEIYRAFTYYLGWKSSTYAAKLMALAAYGDAKKVSTKSLVDIEGGRLSIPVSNNPLEPLQMVEGLGRSLGVDFGEPRAPQAEILPIHRNIAAYIQQQLALGLLLKLRWLSDRYRLRNLCLGGGFALNCVINGALARSGSFERVYVPSTPGDEGQAMGNALWCSNTVHNEKESSGRTSQHFERSGDVQLGPRYELHSADVVSMLRKHGLHEAVVFEAEPIEKAVAELISNGVVVCVFRGRSEAGPRALGQRSILADPRKAESRAILNQVKDREWMQPLAPSLLRDDMKRLFDLEWESPFMSFALPVRKNMRKRISAVVHHDGTARVQTVTPTEGSFLCNVLKYFAESSGIPIILNTSFNSHGKPIVEKPEDAIRTFSRMSINALVLERFLVLKNLFPEIGKTSLMPKLGRIQLSVLTKGKVEKKEFDEKYRETIRWLQERTGQTVFVRGDFPLYGEYRKWLQEGKKHTTIRYRKGGVEIPISAELPLFATTDFFTTRTSDRPIRVSVKGIKYQRFGELTEEDAVRDGFVSLDELHRALLGIYRNIDSDDWVTVYSIAPVRIPLRME